MRRTVGYVRVSTDDQVENGVSLEAQEARIRAPMPRRWPDRSRRSSSTQDRVPKT